MAMTPTVRSLARHARTSAEARVDLPTPGGPVRPTTWPRGSTQAASSRSRSRLGVRGLLQPGQRPAPARPCRPPAGSRAGHSSLKRQPLPARPPGPRRAARSGRGRASTRRSRGRRARRSATEAGSPPCSPQMPSFRSGRVARPRSTASSTSSPTPAWSSSGTGRRRRCSALQVGVEELARSRRATRPSVIWVRSLVPKLKKSACSRRSRRPAGRARQLDHGADLVGGLPALLLRAPRPRRRRSASSGSPARARSRPAGP